MSTVFPSPSAEHSDDLTVVLTLKGREAYTIRWLQWMAAQRFPYRILLADGGSDAALERRVRDEVERGSLRAEYHRYPFDTDIPTFVRKVADAMSRVTTPFVTIADNDDFLLVHALERNLEMLRSNADLRAVGSPHLRVAFLKRAESLDDLVYPDGASARFTSVAPVRDPALRSDDPLVRCLATVRRFYTAEFYYALHRTEDWQRLASALTRMPLRHISFYEWFLTYGFAVAGISNVAAGETFIVRQESTSTSATAAYAVERYDRIFLTREWSQQLYAMIDTLYGEGRRVGMTASSDEFEDSFLAAFQEFLLSWLQFRGVANRLGHVAWLYSIGRALFAAYRRKRHARVPERRLMTHPDIPRLLAFLRDGATGPR